jgi:septum formation protein
MTTSPRFILASGSPRRRDLVASMGIPYTVIKPDIDESVLPGEPPDVYVSRLSQQKADAAARLTVPPVVVLAADTTVVLDGKILGKPEDPAQARDMLLRLRGRDHEVWTAITLLRLAENADAPERLTRATRSIITMREYSDMEIEAYIASGDPFDKAGGYAIQHDGFHPAASFSGSYTNIMGLPVETLHDMLAALSLAPRDFA